MLEIVLHEFSFEGLNKCISKYHMEAKVRGRTNLGDHHTSYKSVC